MPSRLVRVGRNPHPHLLAPQHAQKGDGRFDLPNSQARTLYATESRLTAFLERRELQDRRPTLHLCRDIEFMREEFGADPIHPEVANELIHHAGVVDPGWFEKYGIAEFSPLEDQKWLDLRDDYVIERLRRHMAPWLLQHGFDDFQFRDLLSDLDIDDHSSFPVTQYIAGLAFDSGFAGIVAPSRCHQAGTCWALFEGSALEPDATIIPITLSDRDLQEAFRIYGLRPSDDMLAKNVVAQPAISVHQARTAPTYRLVRGIETELVGVNADGPVSEPHGIGVAQRRST